MNPIQTEPAPSDPSQELSKVVKKSAGWVVALGIITILLGMFAISSPLFAGVAIQYFVGAAILFGGIFQTLHAFQGGGQNKPVFAFLSGLLAILCGGLMFAKPLLGLSLLTLILIGYFVADGLVKIMYAFKHKPESGWGWVLFSGIITLLLGLMLWRDWPLSGAWAIGVLFGINLIFDGWAMIFTGSVVRGAISTLADKNENMEE
ncbi:MAG: HdeD family acid-resistance protein [Verrucomicrobiota bacterium]